MQPSSNERSGLNLPPPVQEQVSDPLAPAEVLKNAPEQAAGTPESAKRAAPPVTTNLPVNQTVPLPTSTSVVPQSDVSKTTQIAVPAIADDGDLIEKEWVNKAKKIVEATRDDPYKQSSEITVFKADYLQKRYNKTIKVNE